MKTSAAWLIDHAGFHKGFKVDESSPAGLSTLHTLALTNRGDAAASDIAALAHAVQDGVEAAFGVRLVPSRSSSAWTCVSRPKSHFVCVRWDFRGVEQSGSVTARPRCRVLW